MGSSRLIATVPVRDGAVVKSYGYRRWRPAGGLASTLLNLDRWNADEIMVVDISRRATVDVRVLEEIASAAPATPVLYGGGVRGPADVEGLMRAGVDRVLVETAAWDANGRTHAIADVVGTQAVVVALPLISIDAVIRRWDPIEGRPLEVLTESLHRAAQLPCAEILVIDVRAEGHEGGFDPALAEAVCEASHLLGDRSLLWFGGIDTAAAASLVARPETSGVAIGNPLHERELALPLLREALRTRASRGAPRRVGLRDA